MYCKCSNNVIGEVVFKQTGLSIIEVMEASFPIVDVDVSSAEVTRRLQTSQAVLVEEYGRIVGIITRHDVLSISS